MHLHIYIHTPTFVHKFVLTYIHKNVHKNVKIYVTYIYIHTYIHTNITKCIHTSTIAGNCSIKLQKIKLIYIRILSDHNNTTFSMC